MKYSLKYRTYFSLSSVISRATMLRTQYSHQCIQCKVMKLMKRSITERIYKSSSKLMNKRERLSDAVMFIKSVHQHIQFLVLRCKNFRLLHIYYCTVKITEFSKQIFDRNCSWSTGTETLKIT